MTPERLREIAASEDEEGEEAFRAGDVAQAEVLWRRAEVRRELARRLEHGERLPTGRAIGTVGTMDPVTSPSRGARVSAAKTRRATAFQAALHERNVSLPEWAATQRGLSVETAKSWVKRPGAGGRPIPRLWADRIAREFDDPALALAASWPNGIRE